MEKVLIATPTSKRHKYCIKRFMDSVRKLTYPFDLLLIDTTVDNGEYYEWLKWKFHDKTGRTKFMRYEWNPDRMEAVQMLSVVKEKARRYMMKRKYAYYFDIASDFMLPPDIIERLIKHDKDIVGAITHIYGGKIKSPMVMPWRGNVAESGHIIIGKGLDLMDWDEVKRTRGVHRVWSCAVALHKRKVMEACRFRTPMNLVLGEDLLWWSETNEKGFEWWCDFDINVEHDNVDWSNVPGKRKINIWMVVGQENATGVEFIERTGTIDTEIAGKQGTPGDIKVADTDKA